MEYYKTRGIINLTEKEQDLLNDLLIFNKRLENTFFNENKDENLIVLIDDLIQNKIDSINPWLAYKMLNNLYKHNILDDTPGTEIRILNNIDCDLSKERLSLLLLNTVLKHGNYIDYYNTSFNLGFYNYATNNMLTIFCEQIPILNYTFMLDHIESFLGTIKSDQMINEEMKNNIINKFLFLYRDINIDLQNKNISKEATAILSNRYDILSEINLGAKYPVIRDVISITPFCQETFELLKINDDEIDDSSLLIIGKHYLDSLLNNTSTDGFNRLLGYYKDLEIQLDLTNHFEALNYIYQSINEKNDKIKEKKL